MYRFVSNFYLPCGGKELCDSDDSILLQLEGGLAGQSWAKSNTGDRLPPASSGFIRLHVGSCGFMWVHRFYGAFGAVPLGILKGFERSDQSELKIAWVITIT